jgi:hypothetical protein
MLEINVINKYFCKINIILDGRIAQQGGGDRISYYLYARADPGGVRTPDTGRGVVAGPYPRTRISATHGSAKRRG